MPGGQRQFEERRFGGRDLLKMATDCDSLLQNEAASESNHCLISGQEYVSEYEMV